MTLLDTLTFNSSANSEEDNNFVMQLPSYYKSVDAHNYGNGNFALTDPSTWGDGIENGAKLLISSIASGLNSFYNTGATVANWFGADVEQNDIGATLSDIDSDLGKYYTENRESADLLGLVITSMVPGLGGVKILNAGQTALRAATSTGFIGSNLSRATGLLIPAVDKYTKLAAIDLAKSATSFSLMNSNRLLAIRAGFGQAALESAAFELMVTATMFKSPVLDDMDGWDLTKNILTGTVLGGAIGGAFTTAVIHGQIKKAVTAIEQAEKPYVYIHELGGSSDASDRILLRYNDITTVPVTPTIDDIVTGQFKGAEGLLKGLSAEEQKVVAQNLIDKITRARANKLNKLDTLVREDVHELTTVNKVSDPELGNIIADSIKGLDEQQVTRNLQYAENISRLTVDLPVESKIEKLFKKLASPKISVADAETISNELLTSKVGYVKLRGSAVGDVSFDKPGILSLADTVRSKDDVLNLVNKSGFKSNKLWSSLVDGTDHLKSEARYIWADRFAVVKDGIKIQEHDIPLLEKAWQEGLNTIEAIKSDGTSYIIPSSADLYKHLQVSKQEVALRLREIQQAGIRYTDGEIAKIANISEDFLNGVRRTDPDIDLFARQSELKKYEQNLKTRGVKYTQQSLQDLALTPQYAKIAYNASPLKDQNGFVLFGMAYIKAKDKLRQQSVDTVVAKYAGDVYERMYHPDEKLLMGANRYGAGSGLVSAANGNYHTLESWTEHQGLITSALRKQFKDSTRESLESIGYRLTNNQEAAIEFAAVNNKIASTAEHYVLNDAGDTLIPRALKKYQEAIAKGERPQVPNIQEGAPIEIPLINQETIDAVNAHIGVNGKRVTAYKELRATQGHTDAKDASTFYPIRPNPKDYPYFAFVTDPSVASGAAGHVSMLHAASDKELEALISKVPKNYEVITKQQSENFHKAIKDFDYDRTLHENHIDADLKRRGVNVPFFQQTNPTKITTDWIEDQLHRDDIFSRELVNAKFEKEFNELRRLGEQYTDIASSKYGGSYRQVENVTKNPYYNYIKTSLDISQVSEHPFIYGLNNLADKAFSNAVNVIGDAFGSSKNVQDLEKVNQALDKYGMRTAYYDSALDLLANHSAGRGELGKFVRGANSILATLVLKLDPLNAINNAVGSSVLLGSETNYVTKAILQSNKEAVGELGSLMSLRIPGMEDTIRSPAKLIANSMRRFFTDEKNVLLEQYKKNGWVTDLSSQFKSLVDDLTLRGNETAGLLSSKLNTAFQKAKDFTAVGEKFTGNKIAEEFNRFIAADVMKQITDVGIKAGVINDKEALSFISTFVNRTQGNMLASQRPLIFQGPIGQAVGLFQTYQFNLMQQMFRYVAEGTKKDAAMLLGLQSTIYGMNGLPAFNFINTHIVGTASGNPKHRDLYDSTYGVAGKDIGDFLLYGLPSNLLHANLFTRGDINPRQATIIPTNPADIPFVQGISKTMINIKDMISKVANGGAIWESFLQAVEHNGLSRPLAGLAQTTQAFTNNGVALATSTKGNIVGANDLYSLSTLVRLAGGRPFDEAVVNDALYRINSYSAVDRIRKEVLSEAFKSQVINKQEISQDSVEEFTKNYTALGGNQREFNKWMMQQIRTAQTPQAELIMQHLKSPYNQKMQYIMGGRDPFGRELSD